MIKAGMSMKMDIPKAVAGLAPALISAPAFANVDVSLSSTSASPIIS
jgi:hypothetical protein